MDNKTAAFLGQLAMGVVLIGGGVYVYNNFIKPNQNKNGTKSVEEKSNFIMRRAQVASTRGDIYRRPSPPRAQNLYYCMYKGKNYGYISTRPCDKGDIDITPKESSNFCGDGLGRNIVKEYDNPVVTIW